MVAYEKGRQKLETVVFFEKKQRTRTCIPFFVVYCTLIPLLKTYKKKPSAFSNHTFSSSAVICTTSLSLQVCYIWSQLVVEWWWQLWRHSSCYWQLQVCSLRVRNVFNKSFLYYNINETFESTILSNIAKIVQMLFLI